MTAPSPDVSTIFEIIKALLAIVLIPLELASLLHALSMDIRDNIDKFIALVRDEMVNWEIARE